MTTIKVLYNHYMCKSKYINTKMSHFLLVSCIYKEIKRKSNVFLISPSLHTVNVA